MISACIGCCGTITRCPEAARTLIQGRYALTRPVMDVCWYERATTMGIIVLLGMTIVLQLLAAVLALRLIRITTKCAGWVLLALAVVLLALQHCLLFFQVTAGEASFPPLILVVF